MRTPLIPVTFAVDQQRYLKDLTRSMEKELQERAGRNIPIDQVLLTSPGKKIFALTVADDGTLTSTLVQE